MEKLELIYKKLHSHFGPQLWWPVIPEGKLHPEYSGGPKNEKQQLEVCFGAILTQNTSWKNVEKAIVELNKHNLINNNIEKLRNELLSINGIGPETADSIILYAAKKPIFVIDAYTKRVMNR